MVKFSVVCPVYNSEAFVLDTIENIVNQSLPPDELVLVDDGSSDSTKKILENFANSYRGRVNLKLIFAGHKGPGAARNAGIRACRNPWIAFIDSDDSWEKDKLLTISGYIESNLDCNIFCHSERYVKLDSSISVLNYASYYHLRETLTVQLFKRNLFSPTATICHVSLFDEKGYFDEQLSSSQDYELWLKLAPIMRPFFIPAVLGCYYERMGSISSKKIFKRFKNLLRVQLRYGENIPGPIYWFQLAKTFAIFGISLIKAR